MTNYRWTICAMLFFATTVNYLDRQVLSLTWDEFIKPEFHWDESHYGTITSVFSIVLGHHTLGEVLSGFAVGLICALLVLHPVSNILFRVFLF